GSRRDGRRVPAAARLAGGAGTAADRAVEGRRLHQRGGRGPAGLRAAHRRAQGEPHPPAVETRVGGPRAMSTDPRAAYEQLAPEEGAHIDAVCDRCEGAWKEPRAGAPVPRPASYLGHGHGAAHDALFRALPALDRPCRERYGPAAESETARGLDAAA